MSEVENAAKLSEIEAIRGFEMDPETARERLKELLADADPRVRAEAASAVWEHTDETSLVETALQLSSRDADPTVRNKAFSALGRVIYEGDLAGADLPGYQPDDLMGEPPAELFARVRDHLLAAANDELRPLDERRFALESLGFLGHQDAVRTLITGFWKRKEPAARLSAIFAMGRSGNERYAKEIEEAIGAKDDELRLQAIWAAGEAEIQGAAKALAKIAEEAKFPDERIAAIESLGRMGGEIAAGTLLRIAEGDRDPEVRAAASAGLEEIALFDEAGQLADDWADAAPGGTDDAEDDS